jgi:hypothetical protein
VAQEGQGSRSGSSHFHRHRGSLDEIGLARVGVRVEALDLAITVAGMWIPLSARLTPADVADNQIAPSLIEELPEEVRFVLGDTHYDAENVREKCEQTQRLLVTSKRGAYPHTDSGVEVRRIFHKLRRGGLTRTSTNTSKASSMCTGRFPRRAGSTLRAFRSWGGIRLPVGSPPPS